MLVTLRRSKHMNMGIEPAVQYFTQGQTAVHEAIFSKMISIMEYGNFMLGKTHQIGEGEIIINKLFIKSNKLFENKSLMI